MEAYAATKPPTTPRYVTPNNYRDCSAYIDQVGETTAHT